MPESRSPAKRRHCSAAAALLALCTLLASCDAPQPAPRNTAADQTPPANPPLAAARIDLAKARLAAHAPDEALALLVSALAADPASTEAAAMTCEILANTRWNLPETTLRHPLPVDRIEFMPPSSLWVSLAGGLNTTVRWNLETSEIEAVLFPVPGTETRSLVFDASHRSVVVERAGVTLLCDAQSLKPIRELDPLPDFVTPPSTVVYSPEGLLLAHPAFVSNSDHSLVWKIRDTGSGEIVRTSNPIPATNSKPLAATLDRRKLRVLHADGGLLEVPVSPIEEAVLTPPETPRDLLYAEFSKNGDSALVLNLPKTHEDPELLMLSFGDQTDLSLEPDALLTRFPWSRHPGLWTGLLREKERSPLRVSNNTVSFPDGNRAPIRTESAVNAVSTGPGLVITGEVSGEVILHTLLPQPLENGTPSAPTAFDATTLTALARLADFLAGAKYDETTRSFIHHTTQARLEGCMDCDFESLLGVFPSLDFSPLAAWGSSFTQKHPVRESMTLLTGRIARATDESAHPDLIKAFESGDDATVLTAIQSAGSNGSAAAKALELALDSTHPEWIDACLQQAEDLPPLLRRIALSRIAWLQDRKADAIAGWPGEFPDLKQVRLREDWDGWETADYSLALEKLRLCVSEELAALVVPENPTPEQRQAVIERLSDPLTLKAVGRARFAHACLDAALALSAYKEDTEATFKLAATARQLGEAPAPCLRAEAMSLTALGDYQNARDRWVSLITEHPVADQLPGDYAEAAYTSFENSDPRQAMAILTTGLHRFPNDANFALRAGWVALLTGNAERAYRFLLTGRQIGYPPEKVENANALLAIAAEQTGATEDAAAFYQDLIRMDPDWMSPETIDTLQWPEELKDSLHRLVP